MVGKKGWLRILEAFIAIILIAGVLIVLYVRVIEKPREVEELYNLQETVLEEIASSNELREAVLNNQREKLIDFIAERVPAGFTFNITICEVGEICALEKYRGEGVEVYSSERIIAGTLEEYNPKKIKIFMWEGQ
ncbi:MAG: hypothetical protein AABX71_02730 [Nanoarchaeota archaeon]